MVNSLENIKSKQPGTRLVFNENGESMVKSWISYLPFSRPSQHPLVRFISTFMAYITITHINKFFQ